MSEEMEENLFHALQDLSSSGIRIAGVGTRPLKINIIFERADRKKRNFSVDCKEMTSRESMRKKENLDSKRGGQKS